MTRALEVVAAVRFVLSEEVVSSAVLGPRTTAQLDQLVDPDAGVAAGEPVHPHDVETLVLLVAGRGQRRRGGGSGVRFGVGSTVMGALLCSWAVSR